MTFRLSASRVAGAGLVLVGSIGACSSSKDRSLSSDSNGEVQTFGDKDAASGTEDMGGSSSGSSSGTTGSFSGSSSGAPTSGPGSVDAACAFSAQKGEQQALNAYMMLDYSGSMVGPKWTGVTSAIKSFVGQTTTGISVGMQYFGLPDADGGGGGGGGGLGGILGGLFGGGGFGGDSCNASTYATPAIEIAPLPGVGSQIIASLNAHTMPDTETPTGPALQGAINHATAWAKFHSSDVTIAILATDGEPSECDNGTGASLLQEVETIAAAGVAQTPKILTFVIGVGNDLASLNGIAQAGGTGSAFVVDTTQNVSQQFLAALNKIRGTALGCQYKIPVPQGGGSVNFQQVNVQFTPANGKAEVVPQVPDPSHCPTSGNAWYYDNAAAPTEILLCTAACGTVSTGGELDVLTGCETVVEQPK
jgi:hypothetical protein